MRTCVVIPTYNEVENIDIVLERLMTLEGIDVLVVDDSSPDGTAERVQIWEDKTDGRISLISRSKKNGLGGAYLFGFAHALNKGYDIICEMDADLSHDPAALPSLIAPVVAGAHLGLGSRYIEGGSIPQWSFFRRFLSRGGTIYARILLGLPVHDETGGFRAYSRALLENILENNVRAEGYGFQIEMTYLSTKYGADIVEVPISFHDRIHGTSKMSAIIVVEALTLVTWWSIRDRVFRRNTIAPGHNDLNLADTTKGITKTRR